MSDEDVVDSIRKAADEGKIELAETDGVDSFPFRDDFLQKILGVKWAFISDRSDLSDFDKQTVRTYAKIQKKYGVDVTGKNNLLEIFRAIAGVNRTKQ